MINIDINEDNKIEEKDLIKYINLHYIVAQKSFPNKIVPIEYSQKRIEQLNDFLEKGMAILFSAKINNEIVGFAWCYLHDFFDEKRLFINVLSVDENFQKKGIGKMLINEIEKYAKKKDINTIDVIASIENENSIGFYEHLNFKKSRIHYIKTEI